MSERMIVFTMTLRAFEIDRDLPFDEEIGIKSQWVQDLPGKLVAQEYADMTMEELKSATDAEQMVRLALGNCVESSITTMRGEWLPGGRA